MISAIYNTALDRAVDPTGAAFWSDQIYHHGLRKGAFVTCIINSVEFQSHYNPHAAIVAGAAPVIA